MENREVPDYLRNRKFDDRDKNTIRIETKSLAQFFRSKEDIYKFFTEQKQLFLPSYRGCSTGKNITS